MINGLDWAFITPKDPQAMIGAQLPVDFVIVRSRDGFRDDASYKKNAALLPKLTGKQGTILWGSYAYLNYNPGSAEGDDQMKQVWDLIAPAGEMEWQIPPTIDAERSPSGPLPDAKFYFDTRLMPAIDYLSEKINRRPLLYTNADFILNYAKLLLLKPEYKAVGECPLWLADWNRVATPYPLNWPSIEKLGLWKSWLVWQYRGDVGDWPGITDVDLNRGQGTRAQWKAWCNGGPLPIEGAAEPPPPVDPPPAGGDLATIKGQVADLLAWREKIRGA